MSIGRICSRDVCIVEPHETAAAAAARMRDKNIGMLVVLGPGRRPIGVLTDRDLVMRVLAAGRDAASTRVVDVMTAEPRTLVEATRVEDALEEMRRLGVRRMPVVGSAGQLAGLISVDDLLALLARELGDLSHVIGYSLDRGGLPVARPRRKDLCGLERALGDSEC